MVNKASKVDQILNAWLEYITLDDHKNAQIEVANENMRKLRGVKLVCDNVLIDQAIFEELQQEVKKRQKNKQETIWALSFPQVSDVNKGKSFLCPLFSLDVTSILKGEYQEQGWNLDDLKLMEAGDNLATFLRLDDEQYEGLITRDGLRRFLETTFNLTFDNYQKWMERVMIPCYSRNHVQRQPYLFKFTGRFSTNLRQDLKDVQSSLRQDLKDVQSNSKDWFKPGNPAYEYLFGEPIPPKHEIIYMGAYPTHPPTDSQLKVIKHTQTEPITAVQGPPGSGKTTLILHVIAQQVVKRALHLIETGENINNLTVVSSTNNKAVDNVIEKLDESFKNELFYLKGGSQSKMSSEGGAIEKLQAAINDLKNNTFNEENYNLTKQEIRQIKEQLLAEESNYRKQLSQRASDQEKLPQLKKRKQELQKQLEEIALTNNQYQLRLQELAEYEELPIQDYRKINLRFDNAERQLPQGRLPWWIRLWHRLWKTEKKIIEKAALACETAIENTLNTPFPVKNPKTRNDLIQQVKLVREKLEKAEELKVIQDRLEKNSEYFLARTQEGDELSNELNLIEERLGITLEDFYATFHKNLHDLHQELFRLSREFLIQQALCDRDRIKKSLELYLSSISGDWKDQRKMSENLTEHIQNLSLIFPVITSTLLSIRNMLPWVKECVGCTIIDEAGMIPQHQTFPLLVRSRYAIIVGDPLQIEPIITLSKQTRDHYRQTAFLDRGLTEIDYDRYSPEEEYSATTYHRAAGASGEDNDRGKGIGLIEHYRCQPDIIQYCNQITGYGLQIKTPLTSSNLETNLIAYHVEGNIQDNVNEEEVIAVSELIQHLLNQGYLIGDIGVISPFRVHAHALKEHLTQKFPKFHSNSVGTIHTFQGAEKKIIILSTMACRSQDISKVIWINRRPNLLNVAVSRAKELFILVGNLYRLEKGGSYTRQLVEHIQEYGKISEYKSEKEIPTQKPGAIMVYDCDHITVFKKAIEQAEQELMIVTPWIRGIEAERFVQDVTSLLAKGVKVIVKYGNGGSEENDNNDSEAENKLRELFSQYSGSRLIPLGKGIYLESEGTNEKILVCDSKFALLGSWNWLSHPYRIECSRSKIDSKVQIRRETSIQLSELSDIDEIKARIC